MNIFAVHLDPREAARCLHDKHVIKMILESVQLLYTCWHILGPDGWQDTFVEFLKNCDMIPCNRRVPYKKTHQNHPCALWVRASADNYNWLVEHALELCAEKRRRWPFNKPHICENHLKILQTPPSALKSVGRTPFAVAMFDEIKSKYDQTDTSSCIDAYREYYKTHKVYGNKWKAPSTPPTWLSLPVSD